MVRWRRHVRPALLPVERQPRAAHLARGDRQAEILVHAYPERLADDEAGAQAVKRHAEQRVAGMLDLVEAHLAQRGPWMLGERYSAVDPFLFVLCRWTRNMPSPARARPSLRRLLDTMMARPAVRRAHEQEQLVPPFY